MAEGRRGDEGRDLGREREKARDMVPLSGLLLWLLPLPLPLPLLLAELLLLCPLSLPAPCQWKLFSLAPWGEKIRRAKDGSTRTGLGRVFGGKRRVNGGKRRV